MGKRIIGSAKKGGIEKPAALVAIGGNTDWRDFERDVGRIKKLIKEGHYVFIVTGSSD